MLKSGTAIDATLIAAPSSTKNSSGEREINPVKVGLALFDGDKKVSDLKPVVLERGEVVCLYITGSAGKLSPVWVKRPAQS